MRKLRAVLVVALASASLVTMDSSTPSAVAEGHATIATADSVTDPQLLTEMEEALAQDDGRGRSTPMVTVEILTDDLRGVTAQVGLAGGEVTGAVPGALVQATVPVEAVESLAASAHVDDVRFPRRAGHAPVLTPVRADAVIGTGPSVGSEVAATGADVWQAAGQSGAGVKVGIVDFFDLTKWATAEHGPMPDASHQFCSDTSGVAPSLCNPDGTISTAAVSDTESGLHGVAVAEIIRDMAPSVELFIASVATVSDLQAAIDSFAANGVTIVSRSLGAAFDGPGDGNGPLDTVVDNAVAKGITWFNSGGNAGFDAYMRRTVTSAFPFYDYVNFARTDLPSFDTYLRVDSAGCYFLDGVRWANDWYLPQAQRTDYSLEFYESSDGPLPGGFDHSNPVTKQPLNLNAGAYGDQGATGGGGNVIDANQTAGAPPLEGADVAVCPSPNNHMGIPLAGGGNAAVTYIRVHRNVATPVGTPDQLEIGISGPAVLEASYSDAPYSAATPVVDSRNPGLVAVGAVDPSSPSVAGDPTSIAYYSSQGPTNDGRIKPDVAAPSGFASTIFGTFSGTSAAAPTAAGLAALLQGAGLAAPGAPLAALVKHFVTDLGPAGADNFYGAGLIRLPTPPSPVAATTPGKFVALDPLPERILDTRVGSHVGPAQLTGPYAPQSVIEVNVLASSLVPDAGVSAVSINLTSVGAPNLGFLQAYPYLRAKNGATSTINIATIGVAQPNFAIVPVGQDGNISVYLQAGGQVVIDVLGYYLDNQPSTADGRFVPLPSPERWMDTRGQGAPLPGVFQGVPRKVIGGEFLDIPILPNSVLPAITDPATSQVDALVLNITAAGAVGGGFVRAFPGGTVGATHGNVNYSPGSASANTAIVPIGAGGNITLFSSQTVDVIVDVVGYISSPAAAVSSQGTFVPLSPTRVYDTRGIASPFADGETRGVALAGGATGIPANVAGVSTNMTAVAPVANGFLKVYPGSTVPPTSSLNFAGGKTVANGALVGVNPDGTISANMSRASHLIFDINGYFVAAPS